MHYTAGTTEDVSGTSLQGYVDTDYDTLVRLFGEPLAGDAYKVDAEWIIKFDDGVVATIYNYKDGKNYCGKHGLPVTEIRDWHVGGFSPSACQRIEDILGGVRK